MRPEGVGPAKTNPMELSCFFSMKYVLSRKNKPNASMSHIIKSLEPNRATFSGNMNAEARGSIKDRDQVMYLQ